MKVTENQVKYVAELARLNLTQIEIERLTIDMTNIISYFEKLNELNTEGIEMTDHVIPINNVFREDKVKKSMSRKKILQNSPLSEDGCFKVPKIVE